MCRGRNARARDARARTTREPELTLPRHRRPTTRAYFNTPQVAALPTSYAPARCNCPTARDRFDVPATVSRPPPRRRIGDAIAIDEYVPTNMPTSSANV